MEQVFIVADTFEIKRKNMSDCQHWYEVYAEPPHPKPCLRCGELTKKTEVYRCNKCVKVFRFYPGPTPCINCGSLYVTWLSYKPERMEG